MSYKVCKGFCDVTMFFLFYFLNVLDARRVPTKKLWKKKNFLFPNSLILAKMTETNNARMSTCS